MSEKEYKKLEKNNALTKGEKSFSELKVTRKSEYVTSGLSRRKSQGKKYSRIVKFEVSERTEKKL